MLHQKASKAREEFVHQSGAKRTGGIKMKLACLFISAAERIKGPPAPCLRGRATTPAGFVSGAFKPRLSLKMYFITSGELGLHLVNVAGSKKEATCSSACYSAPLREAHRQVGGAKEVKLPSKGLRRPLSSSKGERDTPKLS